MAKKQLQNMSADELDQEAYEADAELQEVRARKAEIQAERDRRALDDKFGGLTDAEKDTLAQMVSAEGIETGEEAGELGGK